MAYMCGTNFLPLYTVLMLLMTSKKIFSIADERLEGVVKNINEKSDNISVIAAPGVEFYDWTFIEPVPLEAMNIQRQLRPRRSIHREKIPRYLVTSTAPYSSIVHISVGCVGTLVSPIHVLTAAHCVHDGRRLRKVTKSKRIKIGMLRRNGKQHKIRVKKIFTSKELKPNRESRFSYDYAILKLNRPHRKPYVEVQAAKGTERMLTYHTIEQVHDKRSVMYKYSNCPVLKKSRLNYFILAAKDCPSSFGNSGAAAFESSNDGNKVIGLVSASGTYKPPDRRVTHITVLLRLSEFDVNRINKWIASS